MKSSKMYILNLRALKVITRDFYNILQDTTKFFREPLFLKLSFLTTRKKRNLSLPLKKLKEFTNLPKIIYKVLLKKRI